MSKKNNTHRLIERAKLGNLGNLAFLSKLSRLSSSSGLLQLRRWGRRPDDFYMIICSDAQYPWVDVDIPKDKNGKELGEVRL